MIMYEYQTEQNGIIYTRYTENGEHYDGRSFRKEDWTERLRQQRRYRIVKKRWRNYDAKATDAYKQSRWMVMNRCEFDRGASLGTWISRAEVWHRRLEDCDKELRLIEEGQGV